MMQGVLALVGGGEFEPEMAPVDRELLARLEGKPRVACLATAAGQDRDAAAGLADQGARYFRDLGVEAEPVPVVDRESAMDESLAARIRAANLVYLADGDAAYLHRTLRLTLAWDAIGDVVDTGGVVAGSGAGAMVFGERIPAAPRPLPWRKVFNIFPGAVIVPDYGAVSPFKMRLLRAVTLRRVTLLGIERHTALLNAEYRFNVVGAGGVTVWSRRRHERREAGNLILWP